MNSTASSTAVKMKRSELKRTAMKRRTKRMSPVSERRKKLNVKYAEFKAAYLNTEEREEVEVYTCEFEYEEKNAPNQLGKTWCMEPATDLHHILTRGRSGRDEDLIDPENVMALCRRHHDYIEQHREWALEVGYLKRARKDEELRNADTDGDSQRATQ